MFYLSLIITLVVVFALLHVRKAQKMIDKQIKKGYSNIDSINTAILNLWWVRLYIEIILVLVIANNFVSF